MKIDTFRISEQMKKTGMTRKDLAEKTGIEYFSLSNAFTRKACSAERAEKIAQALGIGVKAIKGGEGMSKIEELSRKQREAEASARAMLLYIRNQLEGISCDCADDHFSRQDILDEIEELIKEIGD